MAEADDTGGGAGTGAGGGPGLDEAQVEAALQAMGYTKVHGAGATAVWEKQGPSGKTDNNGDPIIVTQHYSQEQIANAVFPTSSPYLRRAAPSPSNSPDIRYDSAGHAQQWTGTAWQAAPQFDDFTKAAGYQAPRAPAAPAQPHIQVGADGTVVSLNPYTGAPTVVGRVPELATTPQMSFQVNSNGDLVGINSKTGATQVVSQGFGYKQFTPEQLREQTLADVRAAQTFRTGERVAGQEFTAGENAAGRQFTASENALQRAEAASQFAATYGLNTEQARLQAAQAQAAEERQRNADKLTAARTLADVIGAVDPAAVAAFSRAGGGVFANAIARGGTALTDQALLPAARSLRAVDDLSRPSPFDLSFHAPPAYTALNPFAVNTAAAPRATAPAAPPPAPAVPPPTTAPPLAFTIGTPEAIAAASGQSGMDPGAVASALNRAYDAAGLREPQRFAYGTPRYAFGTDREQGQGTFGIGPARGTFIAGDSTDPTNPAAGGARPEAISLHDPEGNATADVTPLAPPQDDDQNRVADLFSAISRFLHPNAAAAGVPPRFAFGTGAGIAQTGDPFGLVAPEDQSYLSQVRGIREGVDTSNPLGGGGLGYFDVSYPRLAPSVQNRYLASLQSKYGVPSGDFAAEANRYEFPGVKPAYGADRTTFTFGY